MRPVHGTAQSENLAWRSALECAALIRDKQLSPVELTEAILARMEAALKENRLGDVLAQGKKLPPKAALAGEDWLKRVEMRYQIEQALAETEAALKSSLAAGPAGSDRKQ